MQLTKLLLCFLFANSFVFAMDYQTQQYEVKKKETAERIDTLKKALFEKASPDVIQQMIEQLRHLIQQSHGNLWMDVLKFQKAALIGNAESASRVVDLQVQNLARAHKAISAQLQQEHANACTNEHLIKDFLYSYESGSAFKRGAGRRY